MKASSKSYFSVEASKMQASTIRELLKVVKSGDILSMAGGMPSPESFPTNIISNITQRILENNGADALQYGTTKGYMDLRKELSKRLKQKLNVNIAPENLIITAGSQQALYLIGRVFIDEGDFLITGAPTYLAALTAFKQFEPSFKDIPLDANGMKIENLELTLENMDKQPKLLYTVPTFQNPRGVTMSRERREQLLELASEYDFILVEDSPYHELRYEGEPMDPIITMDEEERVLFLGTFSKILAPGMRIGWIGSNDDEFIRKLEIAKQSVDLCTNTLSQHIACEYLKSGKIDEQVEVIRELYNRKRKIALQALEKYMPEEVKWTEPEGGMFLWVTVPEGIDTEKMFEKAKENKVAYVPGKPFYAREPERNTMRVNYTYLSDDNVELGIQRIAKTLKEYIG